MNKYYLAIDIGASSGRHILGSVQDGRIVIEEVHRFSNGMEQDSMTGELYWDTKKLFSEIVTGLKKCRELGKIPESVGLDTWGVDFVLLDENDDLIGRAVGYRDHRTEGIEKDVFALIPEDALYNRTGIQRASYNTIYQLMALKKYHPEQLARAKSLLLLPDYFHFLLSGVKAQEYAEATTTQLLNPYTRSWDYELIKLLGLPEHLFTEISMPGTVLGNLRAEVAGEVGFDCKVVLPPTHDTASAIMAIPSADRNICYISSGTWSLMGTLLDTPNTSLESQKANFTNEGGYNGAITYLTNIMGLWMIQSVRKELAPKMSYDELSHLASLETISSIVPCQDEMFLAPDSMSEAIRTYCRMTNQEVPETLAQLASVIYNSLAECYAQTFANLKERTGIDYDAIHVIGGGSQAAYLNELTAARCHVPVKAGPAEATAIGNVITQMVASGDLQSLQAAKELLTKEIS